MTEPFLKNRTFDEVAEQVCGCKRRIEMRRIHVARDGCGEPPYGRNGADENASELLVILRGRT